MERGLFEKIFRVQAEPPKKDFVVENSGLKKDFDAELEKVWKKIKKYAQKEYKI